MKPHFSRNKRKTLVMLRKMMRFFRRVSHNVNTRWAWFFTNGMKEPYQEEQLIFPEDFQ